MGINYLKGKYNYSQFKVVHFSIKHGVIESVYKGAMLQLVCRRSIAYNHKSCDFFLKVVSDIVLVCGLDRSLQVFDMNKGTVASELPDVHSRAVHCITQNKVSPSNAPVTKNRLF